VTTWSQAGVAQAALAAVLARWGDAGYDAHVRALQAEYTRRRDLLVDALEAELGQSGGGGERAAATWDVPMDGALFPSGPPLARGVPSESGEFTRRPYTTRHLDHPYIFLWLTRRATLIAQTYSSG
jgi:hypothetical protein